MTRGSMDPSNNSGLIKFLDDNRDSYEERISYMPSKCQLRKSNCSFPASAAIAVANRRPIARLQHRQICDILFV